MALSEDDRRVFVTATPAADPAGPRGGGIWEIPGPSAWAEMLCSKLTSNPTQEQWDRWISADFDYEEPCPEKSGPS